jgi:hypothetical protein
MNDVDLSQYDEAYEEAEVPERDEFEEVPDGTYQVKVERVELKHSKIREDGGVTTGGNPMLKWQLRVLNPPYAGRMIFRHNMIMTAENIAWLKSDLVMCGLDLEKLSHLEARLSELLDVQLEVKKVTKGDFPNVYFNSRIDVDAKGKDDDLPF